MSKNNPKKVETEANPHGKTVEELKEVVQNLQVQMKQEQELLGQAQTKAQNHQAKILKMQGALEVILQMIPKQEVEEMIAKEEKANHQADKQLSN